MEKDLYKGTFNWHGEIHKLFTTATSPQQARNFMMKRLADELGMKPGGVRAYFDGKIDNWKVVRES